MTKRAVQDDKTIKHEWFKDHHATMTTAGCSPSDIFAQEAKNYIKPCQFLIWRNPKSFCYWLRYIICGNALFVDGDLEAAVYRWPQNIDFEFLAGCDIGYFASKCEASSSGRGNRQWYEENCREYLDQFLMERAEDFYYNKIYDKRNIRRDNRHSEAFTGTAVTIEPIEWEDLTAEEKQDAIYRFMVYRLEETGPEWTDKLEEYFKGSGVSSDYERIIEACVCADTWGRCLEEYGRIFEYCDGFSWGFDVSMNARAHLIGIQMSVAQWKEKWKHLDEAVSKIVAENAEQETIKEAVRKPSLISLFERIFRRKKGQ